MQINSSGTYVNLILKAFDTTIIPELQSATARGIADIIRMVLIELQKRRGPSLTILRSHIAEGFTLEAELRAHLHMPPGQVSPSPAEKDDFDALIASHATQTRRVSELCNEIAEKRGKAGSHPPDEEGESMLLRAASWEMSFYSQQAAIGTSATEPGQAEGSGSLTREFLQTFLNETDSAAGDLTVSSFSPMLGGYGKQTYLCSVRRAQNAAETELVVRKTDPYPPMTYGFATLEEEYHLLRALVKTGYPSPQPEHFSPRRPGIDGSFYTMPRIRGKVTGSFLGGVDAGHSERFFLDLAELMARLHSTSLNIFIDYLRTRGDPRFIGASVEDAYRISLVHWRQYLAEVEHLPSPYLSWLFDWLENHVPRDARPAVLVHGDFNIHNMLADEGRITGVLDWECAGFGAPEQDLAYIRPYIDKHIEWDRFLEHYKASDGPPLTLDPALLKFCQVYSAVRTNLGGNRCVFNLQSGGLRDIRYAMVELGLTEAFMKIGLQA
jgi:aminoglycoside phosphotransferase (APT) family kinase protein